MTFLNVKNNAQSTLAAEISAEAVELTVATSEGAKFPTDGDFHITIEAEILKCTSRSTDVLTVTRAQEGTEAALHIAGKTVSLNVTAAVITEIQNGITSLVEDDAYGAGWDGDTSHAPSQNAVYDKIEALSFVLLTIAETQVFSGTSPTTWTDLDLSAVVGSNAALVFLKVYCGTPSRYTAFRKNGDTDDYSHHQESAAHFASISSGFGIVVVPTDTDGVIEWEMDTATASVTIDVVAYLK